MKTVQQLLEEARMRINERVSNGEDPQVVGVEEARRFMREAKGGSDQLTPLENKAALRKIAYSLN